MPIIAARCCSSSTPPASVVSLRSTRDWRSFTRNIASRGWRFWAFPCDQFGHQEPGSDEEIRGFCELNYGVTFPLFSKIEVNGKHEHPLYKYMKAEQGGLFGDDIKWNFTKFLVSREGKVLDRFASLTSPDRLAKDIAKALKA